VVAAVQGTVEAIEKDLARDGLVLRYSSGENVDGLPAGEGVFLPCSFWLTDNYVLQRRHRQAAELFERLLSLRSDVGLLAEEYDPENRRLLGNYPQAFTHVALINTAVNLSKSEGPAHNRSKT
jgi:GH15 family glucan-1,4-alpha-glucosidase